MILIIVFKEVHFTWLLPKDSALSLGKSGCCRPAVWRRVFQGTRRSAWGTWHTRRTSWYPAPRRNASGRPVGWACSWWRARGLAARPGKRGSGRVPSCHPLPSPRPRYRDRSRPTRSMDHLRVPVRSSLIYACTINYGVAESPPSRWVLLEILRTSLFYRLLIVHYAYRVL